jgi:hypothetical protein
LAGAECAQTEVSISCPHYRCSAHGHGVETFDRPTVGKAADWRDLSRHNYVQDLRQPALPAPDAERLVLGRLSPACA